MTKIVTNFDAIARYRRRKLGESLLPDCCMERFLELEEKFGNVTYFLCEECDTIRRLTKEERKYLITGR